jgi:hypothetical protein
MQQWDNSPPNSERAALPHAHAHGRAYTKVIKSPIISMLSAVRRLQRLELCCGCIAKVEVHNNNNRAENIFLGGT